MAIVKIICTLVLVAALVFAMTKKMYNITAIMGIGVVSLLIYSAVTGVSVMGEKTCGNVFLDVFEFVATSFTSAFANPGLLIVVLVGFSAYMKEIHASEMLVALACAPMRKIKSPYVICGIAYVVGAIVKLPITSPSGFSALMLITMFPILVACGVNPITAAATIALSQGTDWGPGDMGSGILLPITSPDTTISEYFFAANLRAAVPLIIVVAIVAPLVYRFFDKKEGLTAERKLDDIKPLSEIDCPKFYAILPLLPIVFVLLFSKFGLKTVVMTTQGCTLLSFFIAVLIELIRRPKKFVEVISNTAAYFNRMGYGFANLVCLVAAASCFAKAISSIGGLSLITDFVASTGFSSTVLLTIIGIAGCLIVVASSSYNTAAYTFGPSVASMAQSYGISAALATLPLQIAIGFGRILSPINASNLLIAGTAGVDILKMIKRNVIPVAAAYIVTVIVYILL